MSYLAYMANRSFVFEDYVWSHTPFPYTIYDFALRPKRIPLNAFISGPTAGGPMPLLPPPPLSYPNPPPPRPPTAPPHQSGNASPRPHEPKAQPPATSPSRNPYPPNPSPTSDQTQPSQASSASI